MSNFWWVKLMLSLSSNFLFLLAIRKIKEAAALARKLDQASR